MRSYNYKNIQHKIKLLFNTFYTQITKMKYVNPIKSLFDRIINSFYLNSKLSESRLDELHNQGLIHRGIFFNPEETFLKTPKVNLITKQIEIQQVYMSFLWCLIYNFILLNEVSQTLAKENLHVIQINDRTTDKLDQMNDLTGWAFSLKEEFSPWPSSIPNPTWSDQKIKMANELFVQVVTFLLYHEIAHLGNRHISYLEIINKPNENLTDNELTELKMLEVEADNYAFDMLVGPDLNESTYNQTMGAVMAVISNLYVVKTPIQLIQVRHPDIDTRIFNIMNKIKFDDIRYQMNIDQTLNMGLSLFMHVHKIPYLPDTNEKQNWHDTFADLLQYLYNKIDEEKAKIAS